MYFSKDHNKHISNLKKERKKERKKLKKEVNKKGSKKNKGRKKERKKERKKYLFRKFECHQVKVKAFLLRQITQKQQPDQTNTHKNIDVKIQTLRHINTIFTKYRN